MFISLPSLHDPRICGPWLHATRVCSYHGYMLRVSVFAMVEFGDFFIISIVPELGGFYLCWKVHTI